MNSPLKRYAFDPNRIPAPSPRYNLARTLISGGGNPGFETRAEARQEDRLRARRLKKSSDSALAQFGRLLEEATAEKALLLSCASALYMREVRRRVLGAIHKLIHQQGYGDDEMVVFTFVHPDWYWEAGELKDCHPRRVKACLRRYLDRAGVTEAEGLLFAGLHGEFDGRGYQVHYHGVAVGEKAAALENLRNKFGFVTTPKIYRPVVITPIRNAEAQLSYTLQSFWPKKVRYVDENGIERRARRKGRIPSPHHEEVLVWMAKQNLLDLTIMNGMRIGVNGIEKT